MSDVLLEIADAQNDDPAAAPELELRWRVNGDVGRARLQLASPVAAGVMLLVGEYVREFRSWRGAERDRAHSAERTLLTLGRALGSALVDSEHRLLTFCDQLERADDLASLRVVVRTDKSELASIPWELLILPDSAYVLAAAARAFVRAPVECQPFEHEPITCDLAAGPERALGYLRLDGCASRAGLCLEDLWKPLAWQGALRVGLGALPLTAACAERRWQIVHVCTAITRVADELQLGLSDGQAVSAARWLSEARALGAQLIVLEPTQGGELVHDLAAAALRAGIPNALAITQPQRGWPSRWLHHLLECVGDGLGLQQAVIETRKRMQRVFVEARQAQLELPHAPVCSHTLTHYSARDVVFFATPQARVAVDHDTAWRERMFGFSRPARAAAPELGDPAALELFTALTAQGAVLACAPQGGGLSHALRRSTQLALATESVQRAYSWDFARERYSTADVLEMVAGACGETNPANVSEQALLASLHAQPALFVFDNVDVLQDDPALDALLALARRIHEAGGLCLLGSHAALATNGLSTVTLPAISERDSVAVAAAAGLDVRKLGSKLVRLTEQLQGLPLLVQRLLTDCADNNLDERLREAAESFGASHARAQLVQRFYACRFERLEPHWQRLLSACAPLEGLYLQLLMLGVDRGGTERSRAGSELWRALGAPEDASCASAIKALRQAGFAIEDAAGVCLDAPALRFLHAQSAQPLSELAVALCEGLLRLLSRGGAAVPDALMRHLLERRSQLRLQVEAAFAASEQVLATRTFLALFALLQEARLTQEAGAWAASLLEGTGSAWYERGDPQLATAWLSIAQRVPVAPYRAVLEGGVRHFAQAILSGDTSQRALLLLSVGFLEGYYDQTGDVASYRDVARAAAELYRASDDTPRLAQQLTALAAAEHVLGNHAARDQLEHELLHSFAYGEPSQHGELRSRTLGRIARMRLTRRDADAAELVLKLLEQEHVQAAPDLVAMHCRAELALLREQWELAAAGFCALWKLALLGTKTNAVDIDLTARRLGELRVKLGAERFAAVYGEHAGNDTPTPEALGVEHNLTGGV